MRWAGPRCRKTSRKKSSNTSPQKYLNERKRKLPPLSFCRERSAAARRPAMGCTSFRIDLMFVSNPVLPQTVGQSPEKASLDLEVVQEADGKGAALPLTRPSGTLSPTGGEGWGALPLKQQDHVM